MKMTGAKKMTELKYIENMLSKYANTFFDDGIKKELLNILEKNYSNRHYHSLTHIAKCIESLELIIKKRDLGKNCLQKHEQEILFTAILFHDIIYGEGKDVSDEKMSALMFEEFMSLYSRNQDFIASVKELILSTEHLKESFIPIYVSQHLVDLMADIDLSILSSNIKEYKEYTNNVRKEYSYISDIDFAKGRIKVLISLGTKAENNSLYKTREFKVKNKKALVNINREISDLKIKLSELENNTPKI